MTITLGPALIGFIAFSSYTRTVAVTGQVSGEAGITRITAQQAGLVSAVHVMEGQRVAKDALLFEVSSDQIVDTGAHLYANLGNEAALRVAESEQALISQSALRDNSLSSLEERRAWIQRDIQQQKLELSTHEASLVESRRALERSERALEMHLISADQVGLRTIDVSDRQGKIVSLVRAIRKSEHELSLTSFEMKDLIQESKNSVATLRQTASRARQERMELAARSGQKVVAPHDGVVTSVTAHVGQAIDLTSTLSLLDSNAGMTVVHIYVPGTIVRQLDIGDVVVVEYDSMDSRKYGRATAKISEISRLPMTTHELAVVGGGVPGVTPASANELFFHAVAVPISSNSGLERKVDLLRGGNVRVILPVRTLRLYEWMIDPFRIAKGRQLAHEK